MNSKKMIHLECARGIASLIVVFHHFCLAFYPYAKALVWEEGLQLTPFYVIINGGGAVTFFFFLSGFVLTFGMFNRPSRERLLSSVVKRLPRLIVPAGASVLLGFFVLKYTGGQYKAAAAISGSQWLGDFANATFPENFTPSFLDAFRQCLLVFLVPGEDYYNTNLWTMKNEFYGSILVFGIIFIYCFGGHRSRAVMISLHIGMAVLFAFIHPSFVCFVMGSFLAYWIAEIDRDFDISKGIFWMSLTGAVLGFMVNWWVASMSASFLVMVILLGNRKVERHLSKSVGEVLGMLSFPVYLVHTLVILSVSSFVFVQLSAAEFSAPVVFLLTFLVTVSVSLFVSLPFILLDSYWVLWLNAAVRSLAGSVAQGYRFYRARGTTGL